MNGSNSNEFCGFFVCVYFEDAFSKDNSTLNIGVTIKELFSGQSYA